MKAYKLILLFALALILGCKKEEPEPEKNVAVQGPTITKSFGYGLSGVPPGDVFASNENYQALKSISGSTEVYIHHHVAYKFEVEKKYYVSFQKLEGGTYGTLYQYNADVTFDENGVMTPLQVYANSAQWKDSILQSGESIIYFYLP